MADLNTKIKVFLEANSKVYLNEMDNFGLQNDGDGDYIHTWNVSGLVQPTDAQLNALESQANDLEALNQVYANRQAEYPSVQELVVALYDTEDKLAIENKRAEVKAKYPKS